MRTRPMHLLSMMVVTALCVAVLPAAAVAAPADPVSPRLQALEVLGLQGAGPALTAGHQVGVTARSAHAASAAAVATHDSELLYNLAYLLAAFSMVGPNARQVHAGLRRELRGDRLGKYVHVGPLRGRRFTVTAISDQVCATVRGAARRSTVRLGPCVEADRMASMTPLQDSADLVRVLAREVFRALGRTRAVRAVYDPSMLRLITRLVAPEGVRVSGIADTDRDGLEDDGRTAFHARGRTTCSSLPVSRRTPGRVTIGSCRRLPRRHVQVRERVLAVFRELKRGADEGASFAGATPTQRARNAAQFALFISSHSEATARVIGDRVQFRAVVNGEPRFACYRVSPDGEPARYSRSGEPGTWRLGRC